MARRALASQNSDQRRTKLRNFDENTITEAVLERVAGATDPRIRADQRSPGAAPARLRARGRARHRRNGSTASSFLTRTGQMCDDKRQEFILLSDTLGVSMLVDAINHPPAGGRHRDHRARPVLCPGCAGQARWATTSPAAWRAMPMIVSGSVSHRRRQAARRRDGRCLALRRRRLLRCAAARQDRRSRDARRASAPTQNGRFHFWTIKPARLSDPARRPGRRHAGGAGPPSLAAGACPFHDRGAGSRDSWSRMCSWPATSISTPTSCSASRTA